MKTSKLCWTLSLLVAAQAAHANLSDAQKKKLEKNGAYLFYESGTGTYPIAPIFQSVMLKKDVFDGVKEKNAKPISQSQRLLNLKNALCNGETPKVQPIAKIRFVMPKFKAGIPLDQVQKKRKEILSETKEFLQSMIFKAGLQKSLGASNVKDPKLTFIMGSPGEKTYQDEAMSFEIGSDWQRERDLVLIKLVDSDELKLGYFNLVKYHSVEGQTALDEDRILRKHEEREELPMHIFLSANQASSWDVYGAHDDDGSNVTGKFKEKVKGAAPLQIDLPYFLGNLFLMALPEETQKKYEISPRYGYDNGKLSSSKLLRGARGFWNEFGPKITSVQESPDKDGRTYNYQVSVDLKPFCQYGRPVTDFVSQ